MLLTLLTDNSIAIPSIIAAFAQFPIYGAVLGRGLASRNWRLLLIIFLIHFAALWLCFAGVISNFS